ncbi:oligopeptide transporter 2 [[Candida] railenensis]|uniref:Oligopeptide transporter 2 n=1 Tax=[Candida] railenensis TaxID=45579 RepID=A0A9P0W0S7_9ASCO|nr:oligopeptide transporter 2 [[Candida] railenensis]
MNPEYIELSNLESESSSQFKHASSSSSPSFSNKQIAQILARLGVLSDDTNTSIVEEMQIPPTAQFMMEKISELSVQDAIGILRETLAEHKGDVNYLHEDYMLLERLVHMPDSEPTKQEQKNTADNDYEIITRNESATRSGNDNDNGTDNDKDKDDYLESDVVEEMEHFMSHAKHKHYLNITDWNLQVRLEAALIAFHSPYPEIRAITDPYDDPNMPVDTFRVYVIGLIWTLIGSIINNFFVHRLPAIRLSSHTVQLLLYPSGKLWEYVFPTNLTLNLFGLTEVNLNPGPWTYKEMMLCTIIYSGASGTPYSVYNIVVMKLDRFYGMKWVTWTFQILLALSTQCLGFGFAGIMRKVCIYPAKALWPTILPTIALNRALMNEDNDTNAAPIYGWKISRYSFFCVAFVGSFIYNWIPSFFFKSLGTLNWPTWFNPSSLHLTNITGSKEGLGFNPFPSLDWNTLDAGGCLTIPFYTYANQFLGAILGFFVILAVYYTNNNWTGYLKINTNRLFNNKGGVFNVHDILNENNHFDNKKYKEVGPPYFSAANLVVYGAYFCLYPFAILYHFVTEWESMKSGFKNTWSSFTNSSDDTFGRDKEDPHCKMMAKYDEAPNWWFTAILCCSTAFALICVIMYPTETPIWGIFAVIVINFLFLLPLTAIASVTGFGFGLNVLVELLVGYTIPNSGLALLTLKAFGYNIDHQASNYITDQKLGHYTKLPPRAIFKGQLLATLLNVFVALCVTNWQLDNVTDFCDPHQKDKLSCPGDTTFFFSSVQYGVIGPAKVFGGLYPVLKWCFLLGVLLVIPCAWFKKYGPKKYTRYFQPTLIIGGFLLYAPLNLSYFTGGFYLSYIFMYRIKRDYLAWWEKYNYVLTSALSAGVAISALLMFFTVQYNHIELNWWGNNLSNMGVEAGLGRTTWLDIKAAPDGYFGLRKDQFP